MNDIPVALGVIIGLIIWTIMLFGLFFEVRDFINERKEKRCASCKYRELHNDDDNFL